MGRQREFWFINNWEGSGCENETVVDSMFRTLVKMRFITINRWRAIESWTETISESCCILEEATYIKENDE